MKRYRKILQEHRHHTINAIDCGKCIFYDHNKSVHCNNRSSFNNEMCFHKPTGYFILVGLPNNIRVL
jgi:hypothetical protein